MSDGSMAAVEVTDAADVANGSASVRGSRAWAAKIRKRAKTLSKELDNGYMELAKILYDVYDCPVDGDPKNVAVLTLWGYSSFKEYVESELGIHYKKAQRLRSIWYVLEIVLKDIDLKTKERLVALGSTKMRELARVLTADNVDQWLRIAETDSHSSLVNKIQAASLAARKEALEQQLGTGEESDEGTPFPHGVALGGGEAPLADGSEPAADDGFGGGAAPTQADADGELFGVGELKVETFMLAPDQQLNVLTALARSSELTKSAKKGYNLDLICIDFLATNDFSAQTKQAESRSRYLAKIERLLGVRIVAVDARDPSDVVYGIGTLAALAGASDKNTEAAE